MINWEERALTDLMNPKIKTADLTKKGWKFNGHIRMYRDGLWRLEEHNPVSQAFEFQEWLDSTFKTPRQQLAEAMLYAWKMNLPAELLPNEE